MTAELGVGLGLNSNARKAGIFSAFFDWGDMVQKINIGQPIDLKRSDLPAEPFYIVVSADFEAMGVDPLWDLATLLVESGAMYVAAHGNQGTLCDDAVDMVWVERDVVQKVKRPMVMTTWHNGKTIEDVLDVMKIMTPYEDWKVKKWPTVVLKIGA